MTTRNTVFVRFVPTPGERVLRHDLEDLFSQIGPVKKSSWIHSEKTESSKGYGFVKYVAEHDACAAAVELNNTKFTMNKRDYLIKVQLAGSKQIAKVGGAPQSRDDASASDTADSHMLKTQARVIVRNLSFYATEKHIRSVLEHEVGPIVEVHLPRANKNVHVGFCFVTFSNSGDAEKAVALKNISIRNRTVVIDWSIPKKLHQQRVNVKQDFAGRETILGGKPDDLNTSDDLCCGGTPLTESVLHSTGLERQISSEVEGSKASHNEESSHSASDLQRTVFLRNLPFDATRNEVFELLCKYGFIETLYMVKDKITGIQKGTAFVTFRRRESAERVVELCSRSLGETSQATSQGNLKKEASDTKDESESSLKVRGRDVVAVFAVDKETAATFSDRDINIVAPDRRNMYLQSEARVDGSSADSSVDNIDSWENLPEHDQRKRQAALKDKTTKLQSPIFFINAHRLSIRNLSKRIEESQLRRLCETATRRGLKNGLVGVQDQIAYQRAGGELSTRQIIAEVQEKGKREEEIVPSWSENKPVKAYIPSVYVVREVKSSKASDAPSRGYGFVEFTHHLHALACLRELNNNRNYSLEYAAGGKAADKVRKIKGASHSGTTKLPRLIVDFSIENMVKARKQAERRLAQQQNKQQQLTASSVVEKEAEKASKRRRGSLQRAKKRTKKSEKANSVF